MLKSVYLRAVLGSLQNDALLVWNSAFQKMVGLSWDELARTSLTSLLIVEENEEDLIMQGHDAKRDNKNHLTKLADPFGLSSASISDSSPQHVRRGSRLVEYGWSAVKTGIDARIVS